MIKKIRYLSELDVWQNAFNDAMAIFRASRAFPIEERYSLTDQIRRSSRSVAANIAEAWRKRRYPANFVSKLSDAEAEAAETQTWLQFAFHCGYIDKRTADELVMEYDRVLAQIITMIRRPQDWTIHEDETAYGVLEGETAPGSPAGKNEQLPGDDTIAQ